MRHWGPPCLLPPRFQALTVSDARVCPARAPALWVAVSWQLEEAAWGAGNDLNTPRFFNLQLQWRECEQASQELKWWSDPGRGVGFSSCPCPLPASCWHSWVRAFAIPRRSFPKHHWPHTDCLCGRTRWPDSMIPLEIMISPSDTWPCTRLTWESTWKYRLLGWVPDLRAAVSAAGGRGRGLGVGTGYLGICTFKSFARSLQRHSEFKLINVLFVALHQIRRCRFPGVASNSVWTAAVFIFRWGEFVLQTAVNIHPAQSV